MTERPRTAEWRKRVAAIPDEVLAEAFKPTTADLQSHLLRVKKLWRERQPIGTGRAQSFEELEDVADELRAQYL